MPDGAAALPELALAPAEKDMIVAAEADRKPYHDGGSNGVVARRDVIQNGAPPSTAPEGQTVPPPSQTNRKARRCWSPELHRRFVSALQILGGAQGIHTSRDVLMVYPSTHQIKPLNYLRVKTNSESPLLLFAK